jgi:putative ATPase
MTGTLFDPPAGAPGPVVGDAHTGVPLAERMRPRTLDEIVGQDAVLGRATVLRRLIDEGRTPSLIVWGPPGVGKTSFARALASVGGFTFESVSAVLDGLKEVREVIARARIRRDRSCQNLRQIVEETGAHFVT